MLGSFRVRDRAHLQKRIRLFQDATLQFAIFVSIEPTTLNLVPTFGSAYAELRQWEKAKLVGIYDDSSDPFEIIEAVHQEARWIPIISRGDNVHYRRYPNGRSYAFPILRRDDY